MFGPRELDLQNKYNPNLQDIKESAERTYGEANSFYRKEELYLKDVEKRLKTGELSSEKDIYDECHAIASDLAKCCEMYLKALYIYEQNIPGSQIEKLWEKLKYSEFQTDEKGNLIYKTPSGVITFLKYNNNGEIIKNDAGKEIYFDKHNNKYNDNSRGSKIKRNGHQLDRLIELLSPESSLLLETRMLTIPMSLTEKNQSISILDILLEKGILLPNHRISPEEYLGWIEQHKKTFEEARYSGEKKYDVNVEFLYHLATQIKAVAQYRIEPKENQKFTIKDEELSRLPIEIQKIASETTALLSEQLIKIVASNAENGKKIIQLVNCKFIKWLKNISSSSFYILIKDFDIKEIEYITSLCYINEKYKKIDISIISTEEKNYEIYYILFSLVEEFKSMNYSSDKIVEFIIQIKQSLNKKIDIRLFSMLLVYLGEKKLYNNYNYSLNKINNNNEYYSKKYNEYYKLFLNNYNENKRYNKNDDGNIDGKIPRK